MGARPRQRFARDVFEICGSWEKEGWLDCRLITSFFTDRQALREESEEVGGQQQSHPSEIESSTVSVSVSQQQQKKKEIMGEARRPQAGAFDSSDSFSAFPFCLHSGVSPTDVSVSLSGNPPNAIASALPKQPSTDVAHTDGDPSFRLGPNLFIQRDPPTDLYTEKKEQTHQNALQCKGGSETVGRFAEFASSFPAALSLKRPRDSDSCVQSDSDPFPKTAEAVRENDREGGREDGGSGRGMRREGQGERSECRGSLKDGDNGPPSKQCRLSDARRESVGEDSFRGDVALHVPSRKQNQKASGRVSAHCRQKPPFAAGEGKGISVQRGGGADVMRDKWGNRLCEHARRQKDCKECGGGGLCNHGRQRSKCKDCGGSSICEHGRRRNMCQGCGGSSLCEHGRERRRCKECGGSGICEHGRQRSRCKECGGSSICVHGRERHTCKECGGAGLCQHGRQRSKCKECGGSSICEHGRLRNLCNECGGSSICEHGRRRNVCKECGGSQICQHNRQRQKCKECGGSQICQHNRQRQRCKECKKENTLLEHHPEHCIQHKEGSMQKEKRCEGDV
uniref:Uncharacterized protein n=1 Tax=Chromera velia CCMP2878 TaxID=1169474 RepID=A0A0G4HMQ9_9ALVE|eukprot:Cvel_29373.t1-p1 / transcript=Cvel_29373.t1 / gene=Cvel_29373 / organism=Chromera_velia_CCMP2878 / gene_product=Zinc finger protein 345, putative / transcript_product=Zinc finger protein 345, putative / location=Cvel_scaffold4004:8893-10590(+) / protein_length=566 / sequence_SO=supercontig / SO=protein_coding / is_pseudo=false